MHKKHTANHTAFLWILLLAVTSCKELVTVDPPVNNLDAKTVYSTDASATAALTGIYSNLSAGSDKSFLVGQNGVSLLTGLSSDELQAYSSSSQFQQQLYRNALNNSSSRYPWATCYAVIYSANAALTGIAGSDKLSSGAVKQLTGEAKFVRALCYFTLVNYYGDVPLILTTDFNQSATAIRTPQAQVWQQIITDLKDAQGLLSGTFVSNNLSTVTEERIRPTKWAATALLARVYLYTGDYANAEIQSSSVLANTALFSLVDLSEVFLLNNQEAIWQLQPVNPTFNTEDGRNFILKSAPSNATPVSVSQPLLNAFEEGDLRRTEWVGSVTVGPSTFYFPYKYKNGTAGDPLTEYENVLRLGEQYLIRAEARVQLGTDVSSAQSDLNLIRSRAGLPDLTTTDKSSLLAAIAHERQVELFAEGHRWFDLKRTGQVTSVMAGVTPLKGGGSWDNTKQLYPINSSELQADPKLVQNPGY